MKLSPDKDNLFISKSYIFINTRKPSENIYHKSTIEENFGVCTYLYVYKYVEDK